MRTHVITGSHDVGQVHDTGVVQVAYPDVGKMVDTQVAQSGGPK